MAESVGLDVGEFNQCLSSGKYADTVNEDLNMGTNAGITGTPSFLINGTLAVQGNQDYANFQQQINAALQTAGN